MIFSRMPHPATAESLYYAKTEILASGLKSDTRLWD